MAADTPALVVENAGHPDCRTVRSRLVDLPGAVAAAGITSPATTIIGPVAGLDLGL